MQGQWLFIPAMICIFPCGAGVRFFANNLFIEVPRIMIDILLVDDDLELCELLS